MSVTPLSHPGAPGRWRCICTLPMTCPIQSFLPWFFFLLFSFSGYHRQHCSPVVVLSLWSTPLYPKGHSLAMRSSIKASGSRETLFLNVTPAFSSSPVCLCQQRWFLGPPYYCGHSIFQWQRWLWRTDLTVYIWGHILRLLPLWWVCDLECTFHPRIWKPLTAPLPYMTAEEMQTINRNVWSLSAPGVWKKKKGIHEQPGLFSSGHYDSKPCERAEHCSIHVINAFCLPVMSLWVLPHQLLGAEVPIKDNYFPNSSSQLTRDLALLRESPVQDKAGLSV